MNGEMIAKLKEAKSAEDIIAIAKQFGEELALEKAQELFEKLQAAGGELSDEAVAAVAGGVVSVTTKNFGSNQWKPEPAELI